MLNLIKYPLAILLTVTAGATYFAISKSGADLLAFWFVLASIILLYISRMYIQGLPNDSGDRQLTGPFIDTIAVGVLLGAVTNIFHEYKIRPVLERQSRITADAGRNHDLSKAAQRAIVWMIANSDNIPAEHKELFQKKCVLWWDAKMLSADPRPERYKSMFEENLARMVRPNQRAFDNSHAMLEFLREVFQSEPDAARGAPKWINLKVAQEFNDRFQSALIGQVKLDDRAKTAFAIVTAGQAVDSLGQIQIVADRSSDSLALLTKELVRRPQAKLTTLDPDDAFYSMESRVAHWKWNALLEKGAPLAAGVDLTLDQIAKSSDGLYTPIARDVAAWRLTLTDYESGIDATRLLQFSESNHPFVLDCALSRGADPALVCLRLEEYLQQINDGRAIDACAIEYAVVVIDQLMEIEPMRDTLIPKYGSMIVQRLFRGMTDGTFRSWISESRFDAFEDRCFEGLAFGSEVNRAAFVSALKSHLNRNELDSAFSGGEDRRALIRTDEDLDDRARYVLNGRDWGLCLFSALSENAVALEGRRVATGCMELQARSRLNRERSWAHVDESEWRAAAMALARCHDRPANDADLRIAAIELLLLRGEEVLAVEQISGLGIGGGLMIPMRECIELARLFRARELAREFLALAVRRVAPDETVPLLASEVPGWSELLGPDLFAVVHRQLKIVEAWEVELKEAMNRLEDLADNPLPPVPAVDDQLLDAYVHYVYLEQISAAFGISTSLEISQPALDRVVGHDHKKCGSSSSPKPLDLLHTSTLAEKLAARGIHSRERQLLVGIGCVAGAECRPLSEAWWRLVSHTHTFEHHYGPRCTPVSHLYGCLGCGPDVVMGDPDLAFDLSRSIDDLERIAWGYIQRGHFNDASRFLECWRESGVSLEGSFHVIDGLNAEHEGRKLDAVRAYARLPASDEWHLLLRAAQLAIECGHVSLGQELLDRVADLPDAVIKAAAEELRALAAESQGNNAEAKERRAAARSLYLKSGTPFLSRYYLSVSGYETQ